MDMTEKTLKQDYKFRGRIVNMRVDEALMPDGTTASREVVEHNGGVCVAPLTDDGELIFVRQFRYPYSEVLLELPAGKLEKGEDPFLAGKRELKEETGATARSYISLGNLYPSPGYCGEIIHMYLAKGLTFGEQHLDKDEFLEVVRIPLQKAFEMVMNNQITDSKTQVGIVKAYYLENGKY